MKQKVIVIGGGLAGLSTAAKLAYKGYSVTLLEKNSTTGGRARTFKKKGYLFDMGPSWYMMPNVIADFFKSVERKVADYYELVELKTKYRIFSDDHTPLDLVSYLPANLKLFNALEPHSKKRIINLLASSKQAYKISLDLLSRPYSSILDFFRVKTVINSIQLLLLYNPFQSYKNYIESKIRNPLLQKIFQFHTVFLGGSPSNTPALYSILIAADFTEKIWYPMGGMGELPKAIEKICLELGVTIKTNSEVTAVQIDEKNNRINKVVVGDDVYTADIVVNTADYAYFDTQILPQELQEYTNKYWEERSYAISSVLLYIGVSKKIDALQHHNFYFQSDWEQHFSTIQNTDSLPQDPCYYICAPSKTDNSVAPAEKENLFVLIPTSTQTKEDNLDEYVESVLEHIEDTIGESFVDHIEVKQVYTKSNFIKDYNAYRGNGLGLAHTLLQSVMLRPRMKSKKIQNLFYAGQFTQPGVGVPMVLLSAEYVVSEIEKHESK